MSELSKTVDLQTFLPAKDFQISKQFYQDIGFSIAWSSDDLIRFQHGNTSFFLQRFYVQAFAEHLMMHLQVQSVDTWWQHFQTQKIAEKYNLKLTPPEVREWNMRDFVVIDPSGVL